MFSINERGNFLGAQGATAVDTDTTVVPAPQLPHDANGRTVEKYIHWHKTTPHASLLGDSRVAYDAQTRTLDQLARYLKGGDDYLGAAIDLAWIAKAESLAPAAGSRARGSKDGSATATADAAANNNRPQR